MRNSLMAGGALLPYLVQQQTGPRSDWVSSRVASATRITRYAPGGKTMRKLTSFCLVLAGIGGLLGCWAADVAQDDVTAHPSCPYCGMNRQQWAHSRTLIRYDDGQEVGCCSLRCAAVDLMLKLDTAPARIAVADFATKELIPADTASWVIVDGTPGVMTRRAKWAFATKDAATAFIAKSGGRLVSFEEAIEATYVDMYKDTAMVQARRAEKRAHAAAAPAAGKP
jgi:copper chaperone NosL